MKHRDIFAFILSEATGLDISDLLRLLDGRKSPFLGEAGMMEPIPREKALTALALWNRKKARLFDMMMQSPADAVRPEDLS